jgi:oxygen-independent coproporphyrinogen-3 oxidase
VELFSYKKSYLDALKKQLIFELEKYNPIIETIFIGGGTPSTIDASEYEKIIEIIKPYMEHENIEITIEANPNSSHDTWLKQIYNIGIKRISFGVQSFNNEKLKFLGRNHSKDQAIKAIKLAKEAGFLHINCDIIYDTSCDTRELLLNDIQIVRDLEVDHVSCYSLTLEEGTKFYNKSNVQIEDENMARFIFEKLNEYGFVQYEISNFSKGNSAQSKHNLGYWQYKEYLGIGSGAVGYINNKRYYPSKDIFQYIKEPLKYEFTEQITQKDILFEKIFLGLRSIVGVDIDLLSKKAQEKLMELEKSDKITIENNRIYNKDFLLSDELSLYLDSE